MRSGAKIAVFGLVLLGLFILGFAWRDVRAGSMPPAYSVNRLLGATVMPEPKVNPVQVFRQAYSKIRGSYYKPIDEKDLRNAGLQGLLGSLGDPHTVFLDQDQSKNFAIDTTGDFVGVGAKLSSDELGARIAVVFEDGPAWRAGLRANDVVVAVDGKTVAGQPVDEIVKKIRGVEGTTVRITYLRTSENKRDTVAIRRSRIVVPTIESHQIDDVGYIIISGFSEQTSEQFDKALDRLEKANIKGLVLDVRNNPGGLLETAVELLSRFAEDKVVVKMRMRSGREEVAKTYFGYQRTFRYPITVLINEDSASASEIFAGALRDYKLATLVGEHTYGKSSVQNLFPFVDGSSAKITIARYFLPGGTDISRKVDEDGMYVSGGLVPDVVEPLDLTVQVQPADPKTDSQLRKAIEIIRSKL